MSALRRLALRWRTHREQLLRTALDGLQLYYPATSEIGVKIARGGDHDAPLREIVRRFVGPGELVVDVGANIGASLLQIKLGQPQARVLCLEPSSRFVPALRRTVAANGWTDVRVEQLASGPAGEHSRTLYVNATTASTVAAQYGEREPLGSERIRLTTLDSLVRDEPVRLLKTDTDGFEHEVLMGATRILDSGRPAIYFELDPGLLAWAGHSDVGLLALLGRHGYARFEAWTPAGDHAPETDADGILAAVPQGLHLNVLALPASVGARRKVQRSP